MKLAPDVVALVLLSALLHASWNAIVKSDEDHLVSFALVAAVGAVLGLAALPFLGPAGPVPWRYLVLSAVIHNVYYACLLRTYAHGDLSHVYPIARGLAPLLVAAVSRRLIGEPLSPREATGVGLVSIGIAGLAFGHGWPRGSEWKAVLYAVATGCTIAAYTIADGLGARHAGHPLAYNAWLNIVQAPWIGIFAVHRRGAALMPHLRRAWWRGVGGGVIATIGYSLAIWALSRGAMAHVAALREVSVLFAALMGTLLLGERFGGRRVGAALLIVAGLVTMNVTPAGEDGAREAARQ